MSYLNMNSFYIGNNLSNNSYKKYFDKNNKINSTQFKKNNIQRSQENNKNKGKIQNKKLLLLFITVIFLISCKSVTSNDEVGTNNTEFVKTNIGTATYSSENIRKKITKKHMIS